MYAGEEDVDPFIIILLIILFTYVVIRLWRVGFKKIGLHLQKDQEMEA
jgi:uncharacterized protein YqfA (UPF0365 family)